MRINIKKDMKPIKEAVKKNDRKVILFKQEVLKDVNQNVPFSKGALRDSAMKSAARPDKWLIWDTIYAHFLFIGKVMIGVKSHRPWAYKHETKVYTNRDIKYRNGGHKDWFEYTKKSRLKHWIEYLEKIWTVTK